MNEQEGNEYPDDGCYHCGGAGFTVTCIDDICRGRGSCMHGDGDTACPNCNKDGLDDFVY